MAETTGGELLARCLANEGVRFVFGLPCPEIDPLLAALGACEIRLVPIRHEAAAVHMAQGLYKTTGQVAAVLGNPGPGSANLLPGVITARHEGVPVVVITSQHRPGIVYPSSPSTFQGQDQLDVFRPAVKWGGPMFVPERIPEVTALAFREMWSGRPGPVHLEVPATTLYAPVAQADARVQPPARYRAAMPEASQAQLESAAELLRGASRPLIFSGSGVDRAGASAVLLELVEQLGCPVVTSMAGRSTVPADHPHHVYGFGGGADPLKREADVVLVVGSRLGNLDLPFDKYWGDPQAQRIIQIDVDSRNIGVTRPITLGIVADAKQALEGLVARLHGNAGAADAGARLARAREHAELWWREQFLAVEQWQGDGIHPAHAMRGIGAVFGRDAVYFADGGMTSLWAHWFLPPTRPRSYHGILELGMLGQGIPEAIGAKLADPAREVVCVTGDGAAGFNFMEMQSAAREGLNVTTIVCAEGSWTMEQPNELVLYEQTFGTEMGEVRWDKVGEGLGCRGFFADRGDDVRGALEAARDCDEPAVVCLRTDCEANRAVPEQLFSRFFEVYQGPAA